MGLFKNLKENISADILYRTGGTALGHAITEHQINKRIANNPVNVHCRERDKKQGSPKV